MSISSVVKSLESSRSAPSAVQSYFTSDMIFLMKSISMLGNLPLLMNCTVMEFVEMRHAVSCLLGQ